MDSVSRPARCLHGWNGTMAEAGKSKKKLFMGVDVGGTNYVQVVVPEPSTLALLVSGLIGLLCYAWRKRK